VEDVRSGDEAKEEAKEEAEAKAQHDLAVTRSRIRFRSPPNGEGWRVDLDGATLGYVVGSHGHWKVYKRTKGLVPWKRGFASRQAAVDALIVDWQAEA
jgi:hypothetical protein